MQWSIGQSFPKSEFENLNPREALGIAKELLYKLFSGNFSRKLGLGDAAKAQSLNRDSRCTHYHTLVNIWTYESLSAEGSCAKCVEWIWYQQISTKIARYFLVPFIYYGNARFVGKSHMKSNQNRFAFLIKLNKHGFLSTKRTIGVIIENNFKNPLPSVIFTHIVEFMHYTKTIHFKVFEILKKNSNG